MAGEEIDLESSFLNVERFKEALISFRDEQRREHEADNVELLKSDESQRWKQIIDRLFEDAHGEDESAGIFYEEDDSLPLLFAQALRDLSARVESFVEYRRLRDQLAFRKRPSAGVVDFRPPATDKDPPTDPEEPPPTA